MIELTQEMVDAYAEATGINWSRLHVNHRAGLAAVLAIAERDYLAEPTCVCCGESWPHVPSSARCTPPVDPRAAARAADPHAHACPTCSPDGVLIGPGCANCRLTGMDQTPCATPGHFRSCPAGCCGGPRRPAVVRHLVEVGKERTLCCGQDTATTAVGEPFTTNPDRATCDRRGTESGCEPGRVERHLHHAPSRPGGGS